jgi:hypothetical protein
MKKLIVVLAATAALAIAAAPADAQGCHTIKCFNKQITGLQAQVTELATALRCVQPVAVSRYGGYDYNGVAAATTGLDFTESGDAVSTWILGIPPGSCGSPQTRSMGSAVPPGSPVFGPLRETPGGAVTRMETRP